MNSRTKAETLQFLNKFQNKLEIKIPQFFFISKKKFLSNKNLFFYQIQKKFKNKKIILRSSSKNEDNENNSLAGKFKSFLDISARDKKAILGYTEEIIKDFKDSKDQILVQEFISKPQISGVIFTRDINTNSPYCTINYDTSGKTNLITSGKFNPSMKIISILKNKIDTYKFFGKKLLIIKLIEKKLNNDRLDIEFCIKNKNFYLLQCRSLKKIGKCDDNKIYEAIVNIKKKIKKLSKSQPNIEGKKNCFSNMCDWNPAEMIGIKPLPLALSLYSELITDEIWAEQRKNYGYKNVSPNRLMISLAGLPYIDVRTDFNSFLPSGLPAKLEKKIINYYITQIKKNPSNHDKIEFNLVETCYDLNTKKNLKKFLNSKETKIYSEKLKIITNKILEKKNKLLNIEEKKVRSLEKKIDKIQSSKISEIQKIFYLVNDCKKYGTLPFAGIARSAFIYTKILRTLLFNKVITEKDYQAFYESIKTVTQEMFISLKKIKSKNDKTRFLKIYGHLRPSTYSINSKNYKENYKEYFSGQININLEKKNNFKIKKKLQKKINLIFKKHKLKTNCNEFFEGAQKSIKNRELAKFLFSKSINEIFNNLIKLSKEININRESLEYVSIKNILNFYSNLNVKKLKKILQDEIKQNKSDYKIINLLKLPEFLSSERDLYFQKDNTKIGTFITDKNLSSKTVFFNNIKNYKSLKNKIVLLENADPGYDFIFSYKIKGLVTRYGGANSHMSIRCLELGIPAAIGIGSKDFERIKSSHSIEINCKQNYLKIIS